jgi:hypothetical protein
MGPNRGQILVLSIEHYFLFEAKMVGATVKYTELELSSLASNYSMKSQDTAKLKCH